ncbi:YopJ/AvrA family T3SS effector serine/threonine acetyltransferase [Pluralibacter sp.]|uniref:YopJ/AvrA family T3SS effector serine/threonine acetyltransferase n=1 Tax=Pluralibacter sp. TaxID=1920032 RepID=UPI0025E89632|nr:YopJ/AvrA family T3SS effector serine/threonine acetyltransferase [Pluralibacter sp.]MBV8044681.1 YopJ family type III secretion system effector serine/threonine acetyltransferase [Pluralibacter sp.]
MFPEVRNNYHVNLPQKDLPFNADSLLNTINRLEKDISDGHWLNACYAKTDLKLMPAMVEQANQKNPGLNLTFVTNPNELAISIKNILPEYKSARFIVNMGERGIHFAVVDCRFIDNKSSVILFEPANCNAIGPALLAVGASTAIEREHIPDCHFLMAEMDIQRSSSECGIFSLALAKKTYSEFDKLDRIHNDNINGKIAVDNFNLITSEIADTYLPVTFYKHSQGEGRIRRYINANPEAEHDAVNKKNEKITERFESNSVMLGDKLRSVSAHKKRIIEYTSVLKAL